jgi:CRISPR/Cas system-associated exonuclease Cas4 (RecB family)
MSGCLYVASSSATRLAQVSAFIASRPAASEVMLIAASRGAADDVARQVARTRGATFGLHRFSLTQLAARLAATRLAGRGLVPATRLATEAVAARAVFDARRDERLSYFLPVAGMPGFAPSLGRTLTDLRMASADVATLSTAREGGQDLATLAEAARLQFDAGGTADRAALFAAAMEALGSETSFCRSSAVVLIDVPIASEVERRFVAALVKQASEWIAVSPAQDERTVAALKGCGAVLTETADAADDDLGRLRQYLFTTEAPERRTAGGEVTLYSAPGEGREAMEIARYALDQARRGVRFDEMAVLLRSPREYMGLLEHAFARTGIPAWFGRGTRRPHPAGRALLALLACADENLSAHRFAEYLSLAQVPSASASMDPGAPATAGKRAPSQPSLFEDAPIRPIDDALATVPDRSAIADEAFADPDLVPSAHEPPDAPVVQGVVRAPYRWEEWLVESAVIAGRDRWMRLDGLAAEYRLRLKEARREDPHSPKVAGIDRDLKHLEHLRSFALPLIREFDEWPDTALWGEWLDTLYELVPRVIRQPIVVQRVLAELRPMAAIGPVTLREVRDVLADRLRTVSVEPPADRYGRVFVGLAEQARGRTFRVVFVPGLAERVFPQKVREDPLLSDESRRQVTPDLETSSDRSRAERLFLRLAVGAATERLFLSYPRIELREARPRVPSFYGLDVMRAITGRVPGHEELQADAAKETKSTLAWPAPADANRALDDFEHDLAILGPLLTTRDPAAARGRARYLLDLNPHLRRSLTERWKRWKPAWSEADGLVTPTAHATTVLASQRLARRPYSLTALQRYSACPYQFLLSAIYRLEPLEEPTPVQRLDPLTKGALFHAMQAAFFRSRAAVSGLPVTPENLGEALDALDAVIARVAEQEREALAPAVDRVWRDEIASLRKDLRRWVTLQADGGDGWHPERFELSFGLPIDEDHDPHSVPHPVTVDGRFILRGAIDLIERHASGGSLRVTDHKTGKNRAQVTTTVGGGKVLQPVLYSLVVEALTGEPVSAGRLYYCTQAGGFTSHSVQLDPIARRTALQVLEVIDRGVERAFLAAAPDAGACTYCDYRPICGPAEEKRANKKHPGALADLIALRGLP